MIGHLTERKAPTLFTETAARDDKRMVERNKSALTRLAVT
jgi:hypothetical protein